MKKLIVLVLAVCCIMPNLFAQQQAGGTRDYSGTYEIHLRNGNAVDIQQLAVNNGIAVIQQNRTGGQNQQWRFERQSDNSYKITNVLSNRLMDVQNSRINANGALVQQWQDNNTMNQRWYIIDVGGGFVKIQNASSGKLLDMSRSNYNTLGHQFHQWDDLGGENQQFRLVQVNAPVVTGRDWSGTYEIHLRNGNVIDIRNFNSDNGVAVIQQNRTGGRNQQWRFERQSDGTYTITNVHSNRVMDVQNSRINENGALVQQWTSNNTANQRWNIVQRGDFVIIQNSGSRRVLDMSRSNYNTLGHQFHQWENLEGENQQFRLVPVN
ncbi:MAG: RICIN domain-containing protein [Treponema sp.]|nr:RICIN domain-containing protein [Treponema sp.]